MKGYQICVQLSSKVGCVFSIALNSAYSSLDSTIIEKAHITVLPYVKTALISKSLLISRRENQHQVVTHTDQLRTVIFYKLSAAK